MHNRHRRLASLVCILVTLTVLHQSVRAVTIDMVSVGNPGNAPDSRNDYGSVDHVYQIGKYEVTAGQYTEFLNAVAKADPKGLYHTQMGDPIDFFGANIQRTGSSPNFSYSVASDWANRPVNYVSFWDAARFANWLHNGQPTGPQGSGTTEDGAYLNVGNAATFARRADARFFIPTENEWYKAAYHDKAAGLAASYFNYPTGSNTTPGNDITETTKPGNNANYYAGTETISGAYHRTEVGEFELSDSAYGTFDQGGNVWEWNEAVLFGTSRGQRGGAFNDNDSDYLLASYRNGYDPADVLTPVGFRVASIAIPEPSTLLLLCFGSLAVLGVRKRAAHDLRLERE